MKEIEIIKEKCIACGMCINMDESVFGYDADGKSEVIKQEVNDNIENIADMCPTGAIIVKNK